MTESISDQIKEPLKTIQELLEKFPRSHIFKDYLFIAYESLLYGNLITNIFKNIMQKLERSQKEVLNQKYKVERRQAKEALKSKKRSPRIDKKYYLKLKKGITNTFPVARKVIKEIENGFGLKQVEVYLKELKVLADQVKANMNFEDYLQMDVLEYYLRHQKGMPSIEEIIELANKVLVDSIPEYEKNVLADLERRKAKMLTTRRKDFMGFEKRLFDRWEKAFDEFECLLQICHDVINGVPRRTSTNIEEANKNLALVQIFARSIQIGHEIYSLLKHGFADGANARWRTLHELTVISIFLKDNDDTVSKRYLDHNVVKSYKQAKDYECYRKQLGYKTIGKRHLRKMDREYHEICKKYTDGFKKDYDWIPYSLVKDRTFRGLEASVGIDHLHPYYNRACNAVHGGVKGFYRLGVIEDKQHKVIAIGPSNYGFADPLQLSAQSLSIVANNLIMLDMDYQKLVTMRLLQHYVNTITEHAIRIQEKIEIQEKNLQKEK